MTIVPISLDNSKSAVDYFQNGGRVEVPRPERCMYEGCGLRQPLWRNGSYARQVIFWGLCFLVEVCRFRCRRCGKTASCPYGWLVPYRRFSAEVITAGIEAYALGDATYRGLSDELSELELAPAEAEIRTTELYEHLDEERTGHQLHDLESPVCRPAHTTVFHWVEFVCKRAEALLVQLQKEMIQGLKRGRPLKSWTDESHFKNPNSDKAMSEDKVGMLDRLSFATYMANNLLGQSRQEWFGLRAYFLRAAETRKDVLTDIRVELPTTHTFERLHF